MSSPYDNPENLARLKDLYKFTLSDFLKNVGPIGANDGFVFHFTQETRYVLMTPHWAITLDANGFNRLPKFSMRVGSFPDDEVAYIFHVPAAGLPKVVIQNAPPQPEPEPKDPADWWKN
jgi:hypothetical protein